MAELSIPVSANLTVEVRSILDGEDLYQGVFISGSEELKSRVSESILKLGEHSTRAALINLGWTPPEESKREWHPIETAPKDGTVIILGRPENKEEELPAISTPGRWIEGYDDGVDYMGHNDGFMDLEFQEFRCPRMFGAEKYHTEGFQPTHWMPLPKPPKELDEN